MAKPYYAEYVNHILRFYFRYNRNKGFKNEVDKMNYLAADKVIQRVTTHDRDIVSAVFKQDGINFADNVAVVAAQFGVESGKIWTIISTITTKVAKERRLL